MRKKIEKILAIWLCVVIFATIFFMAATMNVSASPTTLYVGGGGLNNYTNIQSAVDNASAGDTIYVHPGTYYEQVTIDKSLTLQGEDRDTTVVDGSESGNVIYITANYVTISGLKVTNGEYGINLIANYEINHITIRDVIITSIDGIAFYAPHSGGYHLIENSIISNNEGVSYAHQFGNSIIRNCEIFGNKGPLSIAWGSGTVISNNKVHHNIGSGIHFDSMKYSTIENNELYNNQAGITVGYVGSYNIIRDNIIHHNSLGIGFWESSVKGNKVYHNDFIENTNQSRDDYGTNIWDNGYPSGGNYWSDYTGPDEDGDGIGDIPYDIPPEGANRDQYPLMSPWVDTTPPLISSVSVSDITDNSATITWITDENSDSRVNYSVNADLSSNLTKYDSTLTADHSITLTDLNPNTTYYFEVSSTDFSGNTATDDNSTHYYTFTTEAPATEGPGFSISDYWWVILLVVIIVIIVVILAMSRRKKGKELGQPPESEDT